jgi:hypothetical protein
MEDWVPAVIGATSGILGAAVGGATTYATQRAVGRSQQRDELTAALVAYGYALDALHLQIQRLPRSTVVARASEKMINFKRAPNLNRLIEWGFSTTIGRDAERAIDRLLATTNRLALVAPAEVLDIVERVNELLSVVNERDDDWDAKWTAARAELLVQARGNVGS